MPKTIAIVSDIHSNLEALEAVLNDIEARKAEEIVCLGDIVGYGPNPAECADIAKSKFRFTIMGNHDEGLMIPPIAFNLRAQQALEWTRKKIKPGWLSAPVIKARWNFLKNLQLTYQEENVLYVHGSPRQPTTEYILKDDCDEQTGGISKLDEIFGMMNQLCFVGHSHYPGVIEKDKYVFMTPVELNYTYEVKEGVKAIINVGSVGQPRDGDNRSCYVTFDGKTINYHRVEYDFNKTKEKIFKEDNLEHYFGERLALGR
jgi:predicted phosphodiesterase